ncbi:hypothetical protein M422DRAFT_242678 [Sphaerobolus stellatus SS14]|nr:hypothetical protein M422DRAFT_242678 [Sphaerobolus stellatus SS14]
MNLWCYTLHHLFIHPPSALPYAHKIWIDMLTDLTYDTHKGEGRTVKSLLCDVCKGIDHIKGDCKYPQIVGWPALPLGTRVLGGGGGRGRGTSNVGRTTRGRGAYPDTGWA